MLAAALALVVWQGPRLFPPRAPSPPAFTPERADALADSIDSATRRNDFEPALAYALDLARLAPRVSGAQTKLSAAWHNYGTASIPSDRGPRTSLRTSMGKIECDVLALAAADSARRLARNPVEWLAASEVYGRTLEYLGLPVDALEVYEQMLGQAPEHPFAAARVSWLSRRLVNPLADGS